jgi:hypothetical protein
MIGTTRYYRPKTDFIPYFAKSWYFASKIEKPVIRGVNIFIGLKENIHIVFQITLA